MAYPNYNARFGYVWPSGSVGARYHVTGESADDLIGKIAAKLEARAPAHIRHAAAQLTTATPESEDFWDFIDDGDKGHWQFKLWRS
jgi:ABC-type phosphate transport system auxiliary subunit